MVMIRQRHRDAAPAVKACATRLPFRDAAFDASLAILTIHHWPDLERGEERIRPWQKDRRFLARAEVPHARDPFGDPGSPLPHVGPEQVVDGSP